MKKLIIGTFAALVFSAGPCIALGQQNVDARKQERILAEHNAIASMKFLEENSKRPGVVTRPSGLQYEILEEGDGPRPTASDRVNIHYVGYLRDGTIYDSTIESGESLTFGIKDLMPGMAEALRLMNVGSVYRFFIPPELAFGASAPNDIIGPNEVLITVVYLIAIE